MKLDAPVKPANLVAVAYAMAKEGYGWEDLMVLLKIDRRSARSIVFGAKP